MTEAGTMAGGGRPRILPAELAAHAHVTGRFRNVAMRSHNRFDPRLARDAVASARVLAERLPDCLRSFREAIDPPTPR